MRTAVALIAMLAALAGCAIPEVPYDRETAGGIHRIGIVTPRVPDKAAVELATSIGKNLGLIGGLVDAAMQSQRESQFAELLGQKNFVAAAVLTQSLATGLQARGYEVSILQEPRDKSDFEAAYPTDVSPPVDAYLDVVTTGYGYVAAGIGSSTPYRPAVALKVRLVRAKDQAVLMQDTVIYNPVVPPQKSVTIAPDPAYQFNTFDNLLADPDGAVKGLNEAITQSTQQVCMLLQLCMLLQ